MNWKFFAVIPIILCTCQFANAETCTWLGGTGSWDDPAKWSCGIIPGVGDTVIIPPGTVNLDMDREVSFLSLAGGTISGSDTLAISDSLAWTGGTFSGMILKGGGAASFWIGSTGGKYLISAEMILIGSLVHTASTLDLSGGSIVRVTPGAAYYFDGGLIQGGGTDSLVIDGSFDVSFDGRIAGIFFKVVNNGVMTKTGGTGTLKLDCNFRQNGTFSMSSGGRVNFYSAILTNSSATAFDTAIAFFDEQITIDTFATLTGGSLYFFKGTTMIVNGTIPADKAIRVETGNLYWNIDYETSDTIWLIGGTVLGTGELISNGVCIWTNTSINLPFACGISSVMYLQGTATFAGSGALDLKGDLYLTSGSLYLTNSDTIHIESTGQFFFNGGSINGGNGQIIVNDGTFDIGFDGTITNATLKFINNGTLTKTGGTGTLNLDCNFKQYGLMEIQSGDKVRFVNFTFYNTSTTDFDTAEVQFEIYGGTIDTFATVTGGDLYYFKSGTTTINGTIPADKAIRIESGDVHWHEIYTTSDTIWIAGGNISGTGALISNGVCIWTNGKINLPFECGLAGAMYLQGGSSYKSFEGNGALDLKGTLYLISGTFYLTNSDTIHVHSTGEFYFDGGTINGEMNQIIFNDGLFDVSFDATISNGLKFINNGTFSKTGGTGTLNLNCNFKQRGDMEILAGDKVRFVNVTLHNTSSTSFDTAEVQFDIFGGTLDTFATVSGGAKYIFNGSTVTINGTIPTDKPIRVESGYVHWNDVYTTADTIWITGGTIWGSGRLISNGICIWTNGNINLPFECGVAGSMYLQGPGSTYKSIEGNGSLDLMGNLNLINGTFYLSTSDTIHIHSTGHFFFDGGTISGGNGKVILNDGTFTISFDGTISSGGLKFINNGTLTKTGGTGTLDLNCYLIQNGNMEILSGNKVRFVNFILANTSTTAFDTAEIQFDFLGGTIDTFASISGGEKYIFNGSSIYIHGDLTGDKHLEILSGYTYFNSDYTTSDTLHIINGNVVGSAQLTLNGYGLWEQGSVRIPIVIGASGTCHLIGNHYRNLSANGVPHIEGEMHLEDGIFSIECNDTLHVEPSGIFYYEGGSIQGGSGNVIYNKGRFNVSFPGVFATSLLRFLNDGVFESDSTGGIMHAGCYFINNGTIAGNDTIEISNLTNNGEIAPGFSTDILRLQTDFDNSNSTIDIEISGFEGPGIGHDLLEVEGSTTLNGEISVSLIDGFVPDSGYCFTVLSSTSTITDSFDVVDLPGTAPQWKVLYYPNEVVVQYFHFDCPSDDTLATDPDLCSRTIGDNTLDLVAMQSCIDLTIDNDWNDTPTLIGEIFETGTHVITWEVNDGHGDSLSCSMQLTIEDKQAPEFSGCPGNTGPLSTNFDGQNDNDCSTEYNWTHPALLDNCQLGAGQTSMTYSLSGATTQAPISVLSYDGTTEGTAIFNTGITIVSYFAQDSSGNIVSNTCILTVTVVDDELPQITCPEDITLSISSAHCDTVINYSVMFSDNCPGSVLSQESGIGSGGTFPPGETSEVYMVTDASDNTSTCAFAITVVSTPDVIPDTICLGDSIFLANAWQYTAGTYIDTFQNDLGCDSIVHTELSTTTECYWPTTIVHVDSSAVGSNTGFDWDNAYIDLQLALDVAKRYLNVEEIWIAKGTYFPTTGMNRNAVFALADSVSLLGGFAGTETSSTERDPEVNHVYLSGDIGIEEEHSDDVYHILLCPDTAMAVAIDGLSILNANANGTSSEDKTGAGILNYGGTTLKNCLFQNLASTLPGTAIYNSGAQAILVLDENVFIGISPIAVINLNGAEMIIRGENSIE